MTITTSCPWIVTHGLGDIFVAADATPARPLRVLEIGGGTGGTTAGLLPGADVRDALAPLGRFDVVLVPGESLNDDDVFIDDMPLSTLRASVDAGRLLPAHELISALAA